MIDTILNGFFNFTIFLIETCTAPIDVIISNYMPSVQEAFTLATNFFDYILSFIPWILSWFNLPPNFLQFVVTSWSFVILVGLGVHAIKLVVHWYNILKP